MQKNGVEKISIPFYFVDKLETFILSLLTINMFLSFLK